MMSGERFPVIMAGAKMNLEVETGGNLWYINHIQNWSGVPVIKSLEENSTMPWAVQELICEKGLDGVCGRGLLDECWVPRSDFTPQTRQNPHVGGKASWHPGYRTHKYWGRKQTMIMLKALDRAFEMWEEGIKEKGFPLKEEYWHIGQNYEKARNNLKTYVNGEGFNTSECEKRWGPRFGLDRACRMPINGLAEFTPTSRGFHTSIKAHVKPAPNGYKPDFTEDALYQGVDVLPVEWKVPEGHIDVHAIAIASTYPAPELDQSWVDKNDPDAEDAENSRRMLRKAATDPIVKTADPSYVITSNKAAESESKLRALDSDAVTPGTGWYFNDMGTSRGHCDVSKRCTCRRASMYFSMLRSMN